jgi:hypothetical protein
MVSRSSLSTLERELRETIDDYEAMTKASIEFEKERERFESFIFLSTMVDVVSEVPSRPIDVGLLKFIQLIRSSASCETTSTMVLKNEFKKMMRDTRNENMKILRVSCIVPMVDVVSEVPSRPMDVGLLKFIQLIRSSASCVSSGGYS